MKAIFFSEFLKNVSTVWAITPTSWYVVEKMIQGVSSWKKQCIVEVWPWTGAFTKLILKKMHPESKLICIEINKEFHSQLKDNFPSAHIYHDSAENIDTYINKHWFKKCDVIISAIPWAALDISLQKKIMYKLYDSLKVSGTFVTIAYKWFHKLEKGKRFSELLYSVFDTVKISKTIILNLPPAFFYTWIKK